MKAILILLALPLLGASPTEGDGRISSEQSSRSLLEPASRPELECRDTVQMVREERGHLVPQRDTADPDEPILFYALDHEVEGCDVLLVSRDGDVREVPEAPQGPVRVRPAQ